MPSLRLRSGSVAWRAFQGEGTLVHLERDEIHSMNATATLLIERLRTGATVEELSAALCKEFEVDPDTVRRDAVAFVEQLRATESVEDIESDGASPKAGPNAGPGDVVDAAESRGEKR